MSVGAANKSGGHLIYDFNKTNSEIPEENCKSQDEALIIKNYFDNPHLILLNEDIINYIFIDDLIGSGDQVKTKLKDTINLLRDKKKDITVKYFSLIATESGIQTIREGNIFDEVNSVFILDDSFKSLEENSRYFNDVMKSKGISIEISKKTAIKYGSKLFNPPLGHGDCQLLLSFRHNTPDNTLPVFWGEEDNWKPIFKRK